MPITVSETAVLCQTIRCTEFTMKPVQQKPPRAMPYCRYARKDLWNLPDDICPKYNKPLFSE